MVLPKSKLGLNRLEAQLRLHLQGGIGPASRRNKARLALWLLLDETVGQRYTAACCILVDRMAGSILWNEQSHPHPCRKVGTRGYIC
jgi:hypothetical protein